MIKPPTKLRLVPPSGTFPPEDLAEYDNRIALEPDVRDDVPPPLSPEYIREAKEMGQKKLAYKINRIADVATETQEATPQAKSSIRYKALSYSELKDRPPPKAILRTSTCLIPYGLVEIFGKPGVGKSLYAIEFQICASAGVPFHGAKLDIGRRHLYLAAEGGSGIGGRVAEVLKRRGISESDIGEWRVIETPINLQDPLSVDAAFEAAGPGPWDSVTIDTLAQSMTGNENDTQDMSAAVRELKRIREKYCPNVFLIHHEGRSADHARGSIAMDAATDCQLRVYIDADGQTCVAVKRLRDYGLPQNPVTRFKLKDGLLEPATSGIGDREDQMLAILAELGDGEADGIEPTEWRAACEAKGLLDAQTDDAKAKQWERAIARLKIAKRIKITGKTSAARVTLLPVADFAEDFES